MAGAKSGIDERGILGVVVRHHQHVGADGQFGKDQLGEHRDVVGVDPGDGVVEDGQHLRRQLVGPGVDQVQLQVVPGEDPGQLETDVPDPEDRDGRQHGERLEQEGHLTAAALDAVGHRRPVGEVGGEHRRLGGRIDQQFAGPLDRRGLEVAATDRPPGFVGTDDHLGARLPRRVPAHRGNGHQHSRLTAGAQPLDSRQPVHRSPYTSVSSGAARPATSDSGRRTGASGSGWSGCAPGNPWTR